MSADPFERFPYIRLARREQLRYDHMAADVLRNCLNQYSRLHGVIDTNDWVPVRRRKQMTIFRGLEYSGDPRVTIMTGTGLIHGSLEDVMDGLYCDTHANIRTVTTLLKQKYVDGGVFHVNERRTPNAPFRFAGIKWLAVKAPWGMAKHRDLLTYERMGTTVDADGNELAFHVLQSIERPEWPAGCVKGIKREYTSTCYLYRRHSANRVQCFLWSNVRDLNSIGRRLAEYVTAGALLNVVNTVACAEARKCSKLMIRSNGRACPPSNACHICKKAPGLFDTQRQCAGCKQIVCKSCSAYRPVFKIDSRSGKPMEARFCKLCSNKVASTAGSLSPQEEPVTLNPIGRTQSDPRRQRRAYFKPRAYSVNTTSFMTDESSEDEEVSIGVTASYRQRTTSIFDREVNLDRESFHNDPADMVWMPDPSLNDSGLSVVALLSDAESDQKVNDTYQNQHHASPSPASSRTYSHSSTFSDEEVEWATLGLGQFDLDTSISEDEDDDYLHSSRKHLPGRASHHRHFQRCNRSQDWENFVNDLYVLTPTSSEFR